MTWGRIFDPVDPTSLEEVVWSALDGFSLGGVPESVQLCRSLQEAADSEYFFEALTAIGREPIPNGPNYDEWVAGKKLKMKNGKDIWYLGAGAIERDTPPTGEDVSMAKKGPADWTCNHLSIHSVSGDVVWLLRELATQITKLGEVDVLDVVVVHERDEANDGITGTVYFTFLDSGASSLQSSEHKRVGRATTVARNQRGEQFGP